MKKLVLSLFVVILFASAIEAQSTITVITSIASSGSSVAQKKVVKNKQTTTTYETGAYSIGMIFTQSDSTTRTYRSYYEFSLEGIPTNATIQKVTVNYSNGSSSSYSFKLTEVTSVGFDLAANWSAVGRGTVLHSGIAYNGSSFVSTPLKNLLQNNLANGKAIVGALSESESTSGSESSLSIYLGVEYTRPASPVTVYVKNDMHGYNGGNIGVGKNVPAVSTASPATVYGYENDIVNMEAYDNQTGNDGYQYLYNDNEAVNSQSEWKYQKGSTNSSLTQNSTYSTSKLTTDNNTASYIAYLKRITNVNFQNNLVGFSSYGSVTVNGISYNSPTSQFQVVEANAITVTANYYYFNNGIEYIFSKWNDGSTSYYNRTIYPTANFTYTANYIGRPTNNGEYINFGTVVGQPIVINWQDNPNTNVTQYQIWRKVKHNGMMGNETLISTVNRGVRTYTDYDYLLTSSYTNDLLLYDVRAYYTVEGTYSAADYQAVYGEIAPSITSDESALNSGTANEFPTEYSIGNYPNPFNPSTTINYQLPENGFVTIKVYDVLGKEVTTLVNENKSAGYYQVNFDASSARGGLTSGVYIFTINVNNYVKSKKMLLVK